MTTNTLDPLQSLRPLEQQIQELDREIGQTENWLERRRYELREAGVTSKTVDAETARGLTDAGKKLDELKNEAIRLRDHRQEIVERTAKRGPGNREVGGQHRLLEGELERAPSTLTASGIEGLREAALRGERASFGGNVDFFAASSWPDPLGRQTIQSYEVLPIEPVRIADYLPSVMVSAPTVHYYVQTNLADQAGTVDPGANKPESSPQYVEETAAIRKLAHYAEVLDEVWRDVAASTSILYDEMVRGLIQRENAALLTDDGGPDLITGDTTMVGLLETPNILEVDRDTTNETRLDCVLRAITKLRVESFLEPTVIITHPNDAFDVKTEKDGQERYMAGDPLSAPADRLWGFPLLITTSCPEGTGLLGNLAQAGRVFWREPPRFDVHPGGGGKAEFIANKTLVRAEERLVLAVHRPQALVKINLI